eukprot:4943519-Alexandrium_andersonii.AAC.1
MSNLRAEIRAAGGSSGRPFLPPLLLGARGARRLDEAGEHADLLDLLELARLGLVFVADSGERGVGADAEVLGGCLLYTSDAADDM